MEHNIDLAVFCGARKRKNGNNQKEIVFNEQQLTEFYMKVKKLAVDDFIAQCQQVVLVATRQDVMVFKNEFKGELGGADVTLALQAVLNYNQTVPSYSFPRME